MVSSVNVSIVKLSIKMCEINHRLRSLCGRVKREQTSKQATVYGLCVDL